MQTPDRAPREIERSRSRGRRPIRGPRDRNKAALRHKRSPRDDRSRESKCRRSPRTRRLVPSQRGAPSRRSRPWPPGQRVRPEAGPPVRPTTSRPSPPSRPGGASRRRRACSCRRCGAKRRYARPGNTPWDLRGDIPRTSKSIEGSIEPRIITTTNGAITIPSKHDDEFSLNRPAAPQPRKSPGPRRRAAQARLETIADRASPSGPTAG